MNDAAQAAQAARVRRNRALQGLIGGQVCIHAAMTGLRMALPLMLLSQGGGAWLSATAAAGLLLGLFALAPVMTAVPAGRWADRVGYHRPVHAAIALVMAGGVLAVLAAAWPVLMALVQRLGGLSADGVFATAVAPALRALLLLLAAGLVGGGCNVGLMAIQRSAGRLASLGAADDAQAEGLQASKPDAAELKRVFSWLGVAPSFSNVVGPMLAGFLIDAGGYALACSVLALLPLGTLWWSARVPQALARGSSLAARGSAAQACAEPGSANQPNPAPPPRHSLWALLHLPGLRVVLLLNALFATSWDLHTFLVPLVGHQQGLSASAIGSVLGVFAASVTAVRLLMPLIAARVTERQVITGAMAAVALIFIAYPWASGALAMAGCAALLGLALGSVQPMVMSTLHQLSPPDQQGEVLALRSAVINLCSAVLPLGFGLLGGVLGTALLFRGVAGLLLAMLWLPQRLGVVHAVAQADGVNAAVAKDPARG
ncbi:MAG: MFS transporter [Leptothrix sp. (in: b-proteobacteria)]